MATIELLSYCGRVTIMMTTNLRMRLRSCKEQGLRDMLLSSSVVLVKS